MWGSPGQGKSTYLSYLCKELEHSKTPYIRHHYYLNQQEVEQRFSLVSVANSLMTQMELYHSRLVTGLPNAPENLRDWIEACADGYGSEDKRFVVIVDGLDHVWRENAKDLAPLEALFKHLIPVPENGVLVLGTQRVSEEQLPSRLATHVPADDWHELPRMSLPSIRSWLEKRLEGDQFEIRDQPSHDGIEPIAHLTTAFHDISKGHPLHLTYSFEALKLQHRLFLPEDVAKLPACPDGDIRTYYHALWVRLSHDARDALHLVADCDFAWPVLSLEETLGIRSGTLQTEIRHLLYDAEAGLIPFHGSLPAFVREIAEHAKRASHLAPKVVAWLADSAPPYHRWGWLWLFQAKVGSPENLISQPSREWIIESMSKAYPEHQMNKILGKAESIAFERQDYARAVRLRWLKTRLHNGPQFQIDDSFRIDVCALALTDDDYPLKALSTSFRTAEIGDLLLLGRQLLRVKRNDDVIDCAKAINMRIVDAVRSGTIDRQNHESDVEAMLELLAATNSFKRDRLVTLFKHRNGYARFSFFMDELSRLREVDLLLDWLPAKLSDEMRECLELQVIRLSAIESIHIHERTEFSSFGRHPLTECWARLYSPGTSLSVPFNGDTSAFNKERHYDVPAELLESYFHRLFFHVVAKVIEAQGADVPFDMPSTRHRPWINSLFPEIVRCAKLAGGLLARRERPKFDFIFTALGKIRETNGYEDVSDQFTFQRALISISKDLFHLGSQLEEFRLVSDAEWRRASQSPNFWFHGWLKDCLRTHMVIVSPATLETELKERMDEISSSISQFNDRADNYLLLCELACQTESLEDIGRELLHRALSCVMGYGWRKDAAIHHVLEAIELVAPNDAEFAKEMLGSLCAMVANINEITDGDGTRHAQTDMAKMLATYMPNSYVAMYGHNLETGEWYRSEKTLSVAVPAIIESEVARQVIAPSLWDSECLGEIRDAARAGSECANDILSQNAQYLDQPVDELGKDDSGSSSPDTADSHKVDVSAFAPHELDTMVASFGTDIRIRSGDRLVSEWISYWLKEGKGTELLKALEKYLSDGKVPYGATGVFDEMLPVSIKLEGKNKAYRWIVAAQIHRQGWQEYYHQEESTARFHLFAKHFQNRWKDFIADSTVQDTSFGREPLMIPHSRLVQFLTIVGQHDEAKKITREMVQSTVDEISDIPLPVPAWYKGN
nr:NACHT domain-containing protein [Herbaspirillum sp. LeCh32-8]